MHTAIHIRATCARKHSEQWSDTHQDDECSVGSGGGAIRVAAEALEDVEGLEAVTARKTAEGKTAMPLHLKPSGAVSHDDGGCEQHLFHILPSYPLHS